MSHDDDLYSLALTHPTWVEENGGESNQRLEFLGDAVLELCVSELLYARLSEAPPGRLTQLRAAIVCNPTLAARARELGIQEELRLGHGAMSEGVQHQDKTLADAFEALVGAAFLDRGQVWCTELLGVVLARELEEATSNPGAAKGSTTRLQEWVQRNRGGEVPTYIELGAEGADHALSWRVAVEIGGERLGVGQGSKKSLAKAAAAAQALRVLGLDP